MVKLVDDVLFMTLYNLDISMFFQIDFSLFYYYNFSFRRYVGLCAAIKIIALAIFLVDWWLVRRRKQLDKMIPITANELMGSIISLDKCKYLHNLQKFTFLMPMLLRKISHFSLKMSLFAEIGCSQAATVVFVLAV